MNEEEVALAHANLEEAVEDYLRATGNKRGLVVDWVILTAQHVDEGNGSSSTDVVWASTPNYPYYRALGLVEFVRERLKKRI